MNAPIDCRSAAPRIPPPLAPSLERRRLRIYFAQMVLDIVLLLGAFALVGAIYLGPAVAVALIAGAAAPAALPDHRSTNGPIRSPR